MRVVVSQEFKVRLVNTNQEPDPALSDGDAPSIRASECLVQQSTEVRAQLYGHESHLLQSAGFAAVRIDKYISKVA